MKSGTRRRIASVAAGLAALVLQGGGGVVQAQSVIKCADADGNITYQDSACTAGQAGRAIALPKAESRDDAAAWEAAAKEAKVTAGMPKRWVLRARGAPIEIRPGRPGENATEIWRYGTKDGVTLIGFAGSNVAWQRDDNLPSRAVVAASPAASGKAAAAGSTAPAGSAAPAEAATRGPQNRRFVIAGRYCEHVFAEIGTADRQEALPVAGAGNRYVYEPVPGDPQMRTSFSCIGGKVADVERILVK